MTRFKRVIAVALAAIVLTAVAATPASAYVYWNCTEGVACVWVNSGGGGSKMTIAVGTYGYNTCHNFSGSWNDVVSSASASFGGGWDLVWYWDANCSGERFEVYSPMSVSYTGLKAWENDEASSFAIVQA